MDRSIGGWMDRWMDSWVDRWMDGWIGGWMDGWLDGWMEGWINMSFFRIRHSWKFEFQSLVLDKHVLFSISP